MEDRHPTTPTPSNPLHWFPEFWELGRKRLRPQARLLGLSLLVGIIAGGGAIAFFIACQAVAHYALDATAGYRPPAPGGEPAIFRETETTFQPWLLVLVPVVGGILSGFLVFTIAPRRRCFSSLIPRDFLDRPVAAATSTR